MTQKDKTSGSTKQADGSVSVREESVYLRASNKWKCQQILGKESLTEGDIVDFLVALHIVLEVSLNSLLRDLCLSGIKKNINEQKIAQNVDEISFIHKVILFIYNSKFNYGDRLDVATRYHETIGKLKEFSEIRNKLLHGHSISTIYEEGQPRHSSLRGKLNRQYMDKQIERFRFIMEGMRFYLDCLDSPYTPSGKEDLKHTYLEDEFLNAVP